MLRLCPSLNPHRLRLTLDDNLSFSFLLIFFFSFFFIFWVILRLNPHRLRLTLSDEDNRAFLLVVLLTDFLLMGAESANRSIMGLRFISVYKVFFFCFW